MSSQIQNVKEKLNLAISQLCRTSWMFVKDPNRNFTRDRRLPLREVISVLLCMEGGSLTGELLRYNGSITVAHEGDHKSSYFIPVGDAYSTIIGMQPLESKEDNSVKLTVRQCGDLS